MPVFQFDRQTILTIRGKIMLAFVAIAMINGALGLFAVRSVGESGNLVARTYDKPLMAIGHARRAKADFAALELVRERAANGGLTEPEAHAREAELRQAIVSDLEVAGDRSTEPASAAAAEDAIRAFAAWRESQAAPAVPGAREAGTARILAALDRLGALTEDEGFRDRERTLAAIDHYRTVSIYASVDVIVIGFLIALVLGREMVAPIAVASHAAGRIAAGELGTEIPPGGRDEMGQLLASMTVMRDNIRGMMDREIAARRSAQTQLADAIEGGQSGVALIGPDRHVLIANSRLRELFPDPEARIAAGRRMPMAIEAALDGPTGEMRLADGRWLSLSASPSKEGGFVLIATDISPIKEREDALRAARDEAEAANRAKTDFLTTMSHELRTPLSAVIGFSEMIVEEAFGPVGQPRYKEFADDILHAGRLLMDTISDILDIAKAQSGKIAIHRRRVKPETIVAGALRIVRERALNADIDLVVDVEPGLPAIDADTARLRQVLLNLLSNAIKFTPAGGRIAIEARRCDGGLTIQVRDSGMGMAREDIPRALQPFMQVDTSFARRHGGTGLGLPLTKIFVELHGGTLTIDSAVNVGTTVTVTLPGAAPAIPDARRWPAGLGPPTGLGLSRQDASAGGSGG